MTIKSADDVDNCLLQAIVEATCYCLGEKNADNIFKFMEKQGICKKDIPKNLGFFERELENLIGSENKKDSGVAYTLKKAYIAVFCVKLKVKYIVNNSAFSDQIREIKEAYVKNSV